MLKNWILKTFFSKELDFYRDEKVRHAFVVAHKDILDTMKDDLDAQAEELAKKKLQDLLSPVDMNMVVRLDARKGILFVGGERVEAGKLSSLKAEAEYLAQSDIWKLIQETPKALAEKAMFVDDGTLDNLLLKGRVMLYTLASQKNIVEVLRSFTQKNS